MRTMSTRTNGNDLLAVCAIREHGKARSHAYAQSTSVTLSIAPDASMTARAMDRR